MACDIELHSLLYFRVKNMIFVYNNNPQNMVLKHVLNRKNNDDCFPQ